MANLRAQVVVIEVNRSSWFSRQVAKHTSSSVTHTIMVTGPNRGVEAHVPRVRAFDLDERFKTWQTHDQAYAVLDIPGLGLLTRQKIAAQAESYIGRWYDVGQALLFAATGGFFKDGTGTLVCSRLITGAFWGGNVNLFPGTLLDEQFPIGDARRGNVADGYAIPSDLLKSKLEVVQFQPSTRIRDVADFLKL
jgi:hypothetical protein